MQKNSLWAPFWPFLAIHIWPYLIWPSTFYVSLPTLNRSLMQSIVSSKTQKDLLTMNEGNWWLSQANVSETISIVSKLQRGSYEWVAVVVYFVPFMSVLHHVFIFLPFSCELTCLQFVPTWCRGSGTFQFHLNFLNTKVMVSWEVIQARDDRIYPHIPKITTFISVYLYLPIHTLKSMVAIFLP